MSIYILQFIYFLCYNLDKNSEVFLRWLKKEEED